VETDDVQPQKINTAHPQHLPDFDDFQRTEYFALSEKEHAIVFQRNGLRSQLYCFTDLLL